VVHFVLDLASFTVTRFTARAHSHGGRFYGEVADGCLARQRNSCEWGGCDSGTPYPCYGLASVLASQAPVLNNSSVIGGIRDWNRGADMNDVSHLKPRPAAALSCGLQSVLRTQSNSYNQLIWPTAPT
jgi:hypothetical protein